ncbi:5'-nucleotidase C-terminal domain-containing protein [Paraglaciecola sp.]|uniref:bifunctional metallophosphatase/5'-nucleotidase n=1 Tax=Paraglaciecola sp. TaxID=1920173 RepID=UPI00326685AE
MLIQKLLFVTTASLLLINTVVVATEKHLTLVYAGNMPDIGISTHGTYSNLASLLETVRAEETPTVFTFAGGSLGPSPLSSLDKGSHIIDILNTLEPDLMTLTKREFSYSEDELTLRSYEAAFPLISSNIYDPLTDNNLEGISSTYIAEKNDIKIGFISILDEEVVTEYLLKRLQVVDPRDVIQREIAFLRAQKVDLIALTYAKERDYYHTLLSENQIDFALRVLPTSEQNSTFQQTNKIYSVATRAPFVLLRMRWDSDSDNKNLMIDVPKLDRALLPGNPTTSSLIKKYNQRLNRLLGQQIGTWGTQINTSRNLVRTQEAPFGNLVADSIRGYLQTDIAFVNAGDIRGEKSYNKGDPITRHDIVTELPFRNTITGLFITGAQIKKALEHSVSQVQQINGRFLQISGLSFTYRPDNPDNQRVQTILINKEPIIPSKTYTLAISNYLANGGDEYSVFLNTKRQQASTQKQPLISEIVTRSIQQQKIIYPSIENRIKRITK